MKRVSGRSEAARVRGAILPCSMAGGTLLLTAATSVPAQQDYLRTLDAEATKIQAPAPGSGTRGGPEPSGVTPALPADRAGFEALLQARYRGTHVFYRELPANAREEYFEEFTRGVPMAELRERIVDRYLQR